MSATTIKSRLAKLEASKPAQVMCMSLARLRGDPNAPDVPFIFGETYGECRARIYAKPPADNAN